MKTQLTLALLIVLALTFGCSKKDQPQSTEPATAETEAPGMLDNVKEAAVEAAKEAFSMDVDLEKTVADLKAEAAQMDIESLQEVAAKYKEEIVNAEADLKALMDKLSAVPLTEKSLIRHWL